MQENRILNFEDYKKEYISSIENPELFWEKKAENFLWRKKWKSVLEWDFSIPEVKWFDGGKLNITENCLDRHLENRGDKVAIKWIANNPNEMSVNITYNQLHEEVCKFSNVLKKNGVKKGDRVCLYMPMVPELAIAVLSCARIGAIHSVVFAGFSAKSLSDRISDANCSILLTSDGGYRGDKIIHLKNIADEAMRSTSTINRCIVLKRTNTEVDILEGRDVWWHEELKSAELNCDAEEMDSEDPLFILYTSGSTGKPKGIVHSTAGYMIYTEYSFRNVFQ